LLNWSRRASGRT